MMMLLLTKTSIVNLSSCCVLYISIMYIRRPIILLGDSVRSKLQLYIYFCLFVFNYSFLTPNKTHTIIPHFFSSGVCSLFSSWHNLVLVKPMLILDGQVYFVRRINVDLTFWIEDLVVTIQSTCPTTVQQDTHITVLVVCLSSSLPSSV